MDFLYCDLASLRSVRCFVDAFKRKNLPLHVLVNNGESGGQRGGEGARGGRSQGSLAGSLAGAQASPRPGPRAWRAGLVG